MSLDVYCYLFTLSELEYMTLAFAYIAISVFIVGEKSDIYKLKSIGDYSDPCGTPPLIDYYLISELVSSIWTVKVHE
jgi:hypothetical protein